jgi:hypothetical protein
MTSQDSYAAQEAMNDNKRPDDAVIASYRWALLASHVVVLFYFLDTRILTALTKQVEPLCWPYFQSCWKFRFATDIAVTSLLLLYLCLIIIGAVTLGLKWQRSYWVLMVALNVYLFVLMSLDYRLRGNQFYMLFWASAVLLFWPAKRWAVPLILISFYFWAGTLKLNYEWLSGAVLYHDLYAIPSRLSWIACGYAVFLEMVVIWGLIAKRTWVRWLALSQLALFHVESLSQIHWFYPLLMTALLSWFAIEWMKHETPRVVTLANLLRGRAPRSAYVLLAIFAGCQIAPYLYRGDKALTGQGRMFALDMLEARQVCDVHALVHFKDHTSEIVNLLMTELPPRKICDPVVYFDRVSNLCRGYASDPGFVDADFVMHARRTTDTRLSTIVDETNFCGQRVTYNLLSNNVWMK